MSTNKKQWKNVTDNLSLQFSTKTAWSQEEVDAPTVDVNVIRSILPTKTSATRQISDLESISPDGPFLLSFANIPFEATETELKNFFKSFDIINIMKNEHRRGSGIIEFKDFNGLAGALNMNDKMFISRPIRLTIANREDLNRLQSGTGGQRGGRFQNQQRNTTSTLSEDSDNWRSKRSSQPPTQSTQSAASDNFAQNKDKANWREKTTQRPTEEKIPSDNSDNWRRPKAAGEMKSSVAPIKDIEKPTITNVTRTNVPVMQEIPNKMMQSEKQPEIKETVKKASIFGNAKPVDTTAKDLEIEQKIESKKLMTEEQPKTDNAPKTSAWGKKTTSNSPSTATTTDKSSNKMEWRENKPLSMRSKTNSDSQREVPTKVEPALEAASPKPVEPVPAPIPKNVWAERMKFKSGSPISANIPVERNNNAPKAVEKPVETIAEPSLQASNATVNDNCNTNQQMEKSVPTSAAAIQKPPVVISANGPYLDPKSRTPHHSMSDNSSNKCPTAVPVTTTSTKTTLADTIKDHPEQLQQSIAKPLTAAPNKTCGTQSSWSKGPPKGLIEKAEINH